MEHSFVVGVRKSMNGGHRGSRGYIRYLNSSKAINLNNEDLHSCPSAIRMAQRCPIIAECILHSKKIPKKFAYVQFLLYLCAQNQRTL